MKNFDFSLSTDSAVYAYDNKGAYDTLQKMMERKEQLTVEFKLDKNSFPYAWIESSKVAGFKLRLKKSSYQGIFKYLFNGEVTDFDTNPNDVDTLDENTNFQFEVLKMLIGAGKTIQYVPLFRERPEYIKAFLPCFKGKVVFRIKRTDEVLDYLRENQQII